MRLQATGYGLREVERACVTLHVGRGSSLKPEACSLKPLAAEMTRAVEILFEDVT